MMDVAHGEGRLLFVVQEPETIDFSDFALPPGIDAEKAHATIAVGLRQMSNRGWQADLCTVRPDGTAAIVIARQLSSANYACVVIGGALRLPSNKSPLFQAIVGAVRKSAPNASISFNVLSEGAADVPGQTPHLNARSRAAADRQLYHFQGPSPQSVWWWRAVWK
jgi:hypothetical protein